MNTTTKTVIFLIIAAVIVLIITFAVKGNNTESPLPTASSAPVVAKTYTLADIAKHAVKTDCWTAVRGNVYDLTSFIPSHPGGDRILVVCGKDGTAAFEGQHGGQSAPESEIARHMIGTLAK
jgi:cytochrome b involved in lipid metabolism